MTDPAKYDPSKPLYLVDGSGFIFRAYHALPSMNRADGTQVNAVYGFCNMLLKLLTDFDAHNIGVIFDAKSNTFRNEIYPEYKANREAPPEDLRTTVRLTLDPPMNPTVQDDGNGSTTLLQPLLLDASSTPDRLNRLVDWLWDLDADTDEDNDGDATNDGAWASAKSTSAT